jgi:hypothetical protein
MPRQGSILQKTGNFFRLYHHICGETEIPAIYHFWSCVGLISAVLEDRCWCEIYKDVPLKPNLYICLIGPGSLGKGMAISQALDLLDRSVQTNYYRGKITYAHLIDCLGKKTHDDWGREVIANPRTWLVMDELKNGVGGNKALAEEFIALMTELYTATNYKMQTGTRKHGEVTLIKPNVNWLFGSTEVWLRQVLTKDIFESGFVARACFIFAKYDLQKRVSRPKYPGDYVQVYEHLKTRLWMMQGYQGRFLMTPTAEAEMDKWYETRAVPEDEVLYSAWMRQREMLLRFAMILCVADGGQMIIRHGHLVQASRMVKQIENFTGRLIESASESFDSKPINDVGKYIKSKKVVMHSELLRYMRAKRGYKAQRVREALDSLEQEGFVVAGQFGPRGGMGYSWVDV